MIIDTIFITYDTSLQYQSTVGVTEVTRLHTPLNYNQYSSMSQHEGWKIMHYMQVCSGW